MRHVWPAPGGAELERDDLIDLYAYPPDPDRPWVRVNFVASADGAVADTAGGLSTGLHAPGDREVFGVLRELADVVLVGAGTARAERYRGARTTPERRERRAARGQAPVPPIAVVSTRGDLDPGAGLFTDTSVPPLLLVAATHARDTAARLDRAEVVAVSGDDPTATDPGAVLAALAARGLRRVLCEGGPALFGALLATGHVDELCLSIAPQLAGGGVERIVGGPPLDGPRPLTLASVLAHDDGLLLRYRTAPSTTP
ncbi:pyrimidine reductase family protein [Actinomycetospora flava]|uniref:Pyrimidine reductase family protein n=1 Tax=Actinomycetospora flava TaxID=3129232 RepID=A0ABU8M059_9PSEU